MGVRRMGVGCRGIRRRGSSRTAPTCTLHAPRPTPVPAPPSQRWTRHRPHPAHQPPISGEYSTRIGASQTGNPPSRHWGQFVPTRAANRPVPTPAPSYKPDSWPIDSRRHFVSTRKIALPSGESNHSSYCCANDRKNCQPLLDPAYRSLPACYQLPRHTQTYVKHSTDSHTISIDDT